MDCDQREAESRLALVAQQVWAGERGPADFAEAFATAVVYAERSEQPGLLVTELGEHGQWMRVFSTPQRLYAHAGECPYFFTTGADLLELVPPGVGVMVDPDDEHRFPVLSRLAPPEVVAQAWSRLARSR
ncbi:hypothetical protein [Amycolatopsis samaneae]|uniref:SseB protein N-terminal domain-containing protein n=1 Tax=Amycolatopsis samaneae TaxID=664691 RepID=A0ABW5GI90_9PSEU